MHKEFYPLIQKSGYVIAWESKEDWNNTPIFYNEKTMEPLYVFYNKYTPEQWCNHGSKSFTSAVFRHKSDGKVFDCIMEEYTVKLTDHYPNIIDVRL